VGTTARSVSRRRGKGRRGLFLRGVGRKRTASAERSSRTSNGRGDVMTPARKRLFMDENRRGGAADFDERGGGRKYGRKMP